ncbi:hypothetical protein F511_20532 [Dorcoceras hygrometricum]|uniref:Uncharacterized protein n=1 Tax=Dorcoceras hygrometricum TaxID=472368 RepID=A0A2Z7D9Q8_9LAMI|nr:hypothetical protein F511_20532 [Dorcoceras hygrometricum]
MVKSSRNAYLVAGKRQRLVKLVRRRFEYRVWYQLREVCLHECRLVVSLRADVNVGQRSCSVRWKRRRLVSTARPAAGARELASGFDDITPIRSTIGCETPSSPCTRRPDEIGADGFSSKSWPERFSGEEGGGGGGAHGDL